MGSGRPSSSSSRLKSCNVQTKNDETMEQLFINNMPKIPSKSSNQASIFRMPSLNNNTGQTFFTKPFFIRSLLSVSILLSSRKKKYLLSVYNGNSINEILIFIQTFKCLFAENIDNDNSFEFFSEWQYDPITSFNHKKWYYFFQWTTFPRYLHEFVSVHAQSSLWQN